jgi:hypothetical protein
MGVGARGRREGPEGGCRLLGTQTARCGGAAICAPALRPELARCSCDSRVAAAARMLQYEFGQGGRSGGDSDAVVRRLGPAPAGRSATRTDPAISPATSPPRHHGATTGGRVPTRAGSGAKIRGRRAAAGGMGVGPLARVPRESIRLSVSVRAATSESFTPTEPRHVPPGAPPCAR